MLEFELARVLGCLAQLVFGMATAASETTTYVTIAVETTEKNSAVIGYGYFGFILTLLTLKVPRILWRSCDRCPNQCSWSICFYARDPTSQRSNQYSVSASYGDASVALFTDVFSRPSNAVRKGSQSISGLFGGERQSDRRAGGSGLQER